MGKERLLQGHFLGERQGVELWIKHKLEQKELGNGKLMALLLEDVLKLGPTATEHETIEGHAKGFLIAEHALSRLIPKAEFEHRPVKKRLHRSFLPF